MRSRRVSLTEAESDQGDRPTPKVATRGALAIPVHSATSDRGTSPTVREGSSTNRGAVADISQG
jgi:hypothetical protein